MRAEARWQAHPDERRSPSRTSARAGRTARHRQAGAQTACGEAVASSDLKTQLATISAADGEALRALWCERNGSAVPDLPEAILRHLSAYQVQAAAAPVVDGSTAVAVTPRARIEDEAPAIQKVKQSSLSPEDPKPLHRPDLPVGSRLVRAWNGTTVHVEVCVDGYLWNETIYRSLSAVAGAVTGRKRAGPRFFGLSGR